MFLRKLASDWAFHAVRLVCINLIPDHIWASVWDLRERECVCVEECGIVVTQHINQVEPYKPVEQDRFSPSPFTTD